MRKRRFAKPLTGVIAGLLAGFFGSGGGIVVVEGLQRAGVDDKQAHATSLAVIFPISAVSAALYTLGGHVRLAETLLLCAGSAAGGLVGALFLQRIEKKLLARIFTLLMLFSGVRMLF